MAGFGNILRRITGRLREQEGSSLPAPAPDAGSAPMPDLPAGPPVAAGQEALSLGSEAAPAPMVELPAAMVAEPVGPNPVGSNPAGSPPVAPTPAGVGQVRLPDDDAVAEDRLLSDCPYCGQSNQRIGTRCQRCSRVVVRLPAWAQHRRHNWLLSRISWKRIIFSAAVSLFLVFVIWLNYPFAPNPVILLKKIQSEMMADVGPGVWTVSGRDLRNSRSMEVGYPPPDGEVVWNSFLPEPLDSEPVSQHANVYAGSANGIYKIAEHDGQIREGWKGATPGRITGAAAVVESYLFFGSTDHTVNAWSTLNGDAWWSFPAEDTVEVAPVVSDGLVYISSGKAWLYALDARSGSLIWRTQLDSNASNSVAIHDGRLFVGDDKGIFYILSARTGQEWFRYRTLKTIAGSPVVSADGTRAYFPSSGQLYAVSAEEREVPGLYQFKKIWAQLWLWQVPGVPRPPGQQGGLWRFSPENPLQGIFSSPALSDGDDGSVLYVGGYDHNMYALDAVDGSELWTFLADDAIHASPLIVKDRLIFGDDSGNLYSLDRHDGSLDWRISLSSAVKIPPTLSNELLIVRTNDGNIYGIK